MRHRVSQDDVSGGAVMRHEDLTRAASGPTIVAVVALLGALGVVAAVMNKFPVAAVCAVALLVACALVALPYARTATFDPFHPLVLVAAYIAIYYAIRAMALMASVARRSIEVNLVVLRFQGEYLAPALLVAAGALAAFAVGFRIPGSRALLRVMPRTDDMPPATDPIWRRRGNALLALGAVGHGAYLRRLLTGQGLVAGLDTVIETTQVLAWAGIAIILTHRARSGRGRSWAVVAYVVVIGAVFAVIGYRAQGTALVLAYLASSHYGVRRLRIRVVVATVGLVALLGFPVVSALRFEGTVGIAPGGVEGLLRVPSRLAEGSQIFAAAHRAPGVRGYLGETARNLTYRLYGADTLVTIVAQTPDPHPYIWKERTQTLLQMFIPRVLWAGKPLPNISEYFKQAYWGALPGNASNQKPGIVGDWYIQGGIAAVAIGMLLFGIVCRAGRRWFEDRRENPFAIGCYVVMVITMASLENDTILLVTRIVFVFATFHALRWWLPRTSRSATPDKRSG